MKLHIMILIVLCAFAASKHVEKKQERRELFVVTLTVACAAAVVGAVASAVTTNALNSQGQAAAPVNQPVQVHVHLYNQNGEWVQGPPPNGANGPNGGADMSTARRLLAASEKESSGSTQNAQACPAGTLKLPVGQYENGGYRILNEYAKTSEKDCAWWDSKEAMKMDKQYGIKALMPPGCMPFTAKAKSGTAAKQAVIAKGSKTAGVRSEVSVATPVSKWQPMVVVAFGLALVMVACFAACRKNANQGVAYVHLADDVDEL